MTAAAAGVVTSVVNLGSRSYGRYVVVDHGNGWTTLYAHLLSQWVTTGQSVDQGQLIGQVGSTGGSTGPHLHFEERMNRRDLPSYFHRLPFKMGSHPDLAELRRHRAAGRRLERRRHRGARPVPPGRGDQVHPAPHRDHAAADPVRRRHGPARQR